LPYLCVAVFVTHGGLGRSTGTMTIAEIDKLNRFGEPGVEGGMSELLWSGRAYACLATLQLQLDHSIHQNTKLEVSKCVLISITPLHYTDPSEISAGHKQNQRGGDTTVFGADVTAEFLRANDLKVM
jgi:hypothetical protein